MPGSLSFPIQADGQPLVRVIKRMAGTEDDLAVDDIKMGIKYCLLPRMEGHSNPMQVIRDRISRVVPAALVAQSGGGWATVAAAARAAFLPAQYPFSLLDH